MQSGMSWKEILQLRERKTFPLVDARLGEAYRRIYPLMQREVARGLESLAEFDLDLIVFGSALTMYCNCMSDLDLCIRTKEYDLDYFHQIQIAVFRCVTVPCDVIYYNDLGENEKIKTEIDETGYKMKEMGRCACSLKKRERITM